MKLIEWFKLTDGNFLTDIALWLILLLPVTAYANITYPFSFGRLLFFMFWLTLLMIGTMLTSRWHFVYAWWKTPILWLFLAWLGTATISLLTSVQQSRSFWGSISRGDGLFFFIGLWIFLLLLLLLLRERVRWLKLLAVMSWVGTLSAVFSISQWLGFSWIYRIASGARVGGLMGNPIFLGTLLLITGFLTVYFWLYAKGKVQRITYFIAAILQLIALLLTASRGPLLGLMVGGIILIIGSWSIYKKSINWQWNKLWWGILPVITIAIIGWSEKAVWSRLIQFDLQSDSIKSRLLAWSALREAVTAHPWWGWGLENVQAAFNSFYRPGLASMGVAETVYDRAHNLLLDHLLTTGWIGTLVAGIFLWSIIRIVIQQIKLAKRQGDLQRALLFTTLLAIGGAYFASLLTAFDVIETLLYGTIILGFIIGATAPTIKNQSIELKWLILLPITFFAIWLTLDLHYLVPAFKSGYNAMFGIRTADAGYYPEARKYFNRAQEYPNPYLNQILWRFPSFTRQYAFDLIDQEKFAAARETAIDGLVILERVTKINPGNPTLAMDGPLLNVILAKFDTERLAVAQQYFDSIIKKNPNREYLYLDWGRILTGVGKFTEAKSMMDKAAELASPPRETGFWLAIWGMESKQMSKVDIIKNFTDSADKKASFPKGNEEILRMVVAYLVQQESYVTAEFYQGKLVGLDPNAVDERINLSVIYQALGKLDEAAEQARLVAKMDPSKLEQTKQFLQSIGRSL